MLKSRLKYNEAKYFYEQMESNFKERKTEEFKHCINAFLSSARSVTFVLQKEFRKYKGFDEWYGIQSSSDESMYTSRHGFAESGVDETFVMESRKGETPKKVRPWDLE